MNPKLSFFSDQWKHQTELKTLVLQILTFSVNILIAFFITFKLYYKMFKCKHIDFKANQVFNYIVQTDYDLVFNWQAMVCFFFSKEYRKMCMSVLTYLVERMFAEQNCINYKENIILILWLIKTKYTLYKCMNILSKLI